MFSLDLASKIKAISTPRTSREDVIDYFKEHFPGQKTDKKGKVTFDWKTQIVKALGDTVVDSKGNPYKKASLQRRFQNDTKTGKGRHESTAPSKKQSEEYKQLGAKLPGKLPFGVLVEGNVCIRYQDNPCEPRYISEKIEGNELKYLGQTMDMQAIINKYMAIAMYTPDPTMTECPCSGDTGDCECGFDITPYGEDETVGQRPKRQFVGGNKGATKKPTFAPIPKDKGTVRRAVRLKQGPATLTPDQVTNLLQS